MRPVATASTEQVYEEAFERSRAHAERVESMLQSEDMKHKEHGELEQFMFEQKNEWGRLMLEDNLRYRAILEQRRQVVDAEGKEHKIVRGSERHLETVVGRVSVPRLAYQSPGSADLHPMDAALNLPQELFSHGVRHLVAREAAMSSYDEVVDRVATYTGAKISKRQVEELAVRASRDFEAFYEERAQSRAPSEDLLVISTDGKGIVMRHEDLREGTKRAAEQSNHKLQTRLSAGEKRNRKRMAQVATVYSVAPHVRRPVDIVHRLREPDKPDTQRPRPTDKRVWASVQQAGAAVIREAFEEAQRRDPEHSRRWVVLVDGEPKQLRAVKAEARRLEVEVTILADIVHVIEYIWDAARAIFGPSSAEAEKWVANRLLALLGGRSGGEVAKTIRWWQARAELDKSANKAIDSTCRYLSNRKRTRIMRYDEALAAGFPIATGVIEGACRYLVKDRMDRGGARWSLTGAEAVLRLRALRASNDFDEYWQFHLEQERLRNHASRYQDAKIPDPMPRPRPKLRRVK